MRDLNLPVSPLLIALALAGCMPEAPVGTAVSLDTCASGLMWTDGDKGSSHMYPGRDCIGCHVETGEGPRYGAAGTLYERPGAPSDCYGAPGGAVELVDEAGSTFVMKTNAAGNFWASRKELAALSGTFTVTVHAAGRAWPGATPHSDSNCAACHDGTTLGRVTAAP